MTAALMLVGVGFIAGACFGAVVGGYREWNRHTGGTWAARGADGLGGRAEE